MWVVTEAIGGRRPTRGVCRVIREDTDDAPREHQGLRFV